MMKKNEARNATIIRMFKERPERSHPELVKELAKIGIHVNRDIVASVIKVARDKGEVQVNFNRRSAVKSKSPGNANALKRFEARREIADEQFTPDNSEKLRKAMVGAIMALRPNQCRFPVDAESEAFVFCSEVKLPGKSYCRCHEALTDERKRRVKE